MSGRLRAATGGRIDRTRTIDFTFDGVRMSGHPGDTLASALLAHGLTFVGRSFKYHRPRGILTAGPEEPNALVTVKRGSGRVTPNLRATEVELYEGLVAVSQNRWPSLGFDVGAINTLFAPLLPAGFYYKTFMGPRSAGGKLWARLFEPAIRRAAGLGKAPTAPDPDHYSSCYAHCDVLVVGAGPAGLAAALAASDGGARVILCDEQSVMGGTLLSEPFARIDGMSATEWSRSRVADLARRANVTLLSRTTAFGYHTQNFVALAERCTDHLAQPSPQMPRERLWQVRAKEVVLATGAIERPLVFPGNDLPGVMMAGAAGTYLTCYGVKPGDRIVIVTAHDTAYVTALALHAAGVEVAQIIDVRSTPTGDAVERARAVGLPVLAGHTVLRAEGGKRVTGVHLGQIDASGKVTKANGVACDALLMCGGWTPSVHLFSQSRGKLAWSDAWQSYVPGEAAQAQCSAGACNGAHDLSDALGEGFAAGTAAAKAAGHAGVAPATPRIEDAPSLRGGHIGPVPLSATAERKGKAFVDFQNDVTMKDIALATREGFRSIEHIKRYTTAGMATDQGKTSNINALGVASRHLGSPVPAIGLTTFRQPYTPVTFGTLAHHNRGDLFDPVRRTPIDPWAQVRGALFEDVGQWKRARYFPQAGETMHQAVTRECQIVRERVGMFDASTLGKIEVVGPDAGAFLDRLYINNVSNLKVGACRYCIQCNEAGFVMDDGIVARVAEDRFHVTTTTGGAVGVLNLMEDYLQTEWPQMQVWLTSTTEQWAVIAVQGPRARDVVAPHVTDADISADALPHMRMLACTVAGVPARLFRASFTGELGFEINVASDQGLAVWEALWKTCTSLSGVAYGTETMHVLRAEKGFIIVGQETDGTVTPHDLGLARMISTSKADFVGKRSHSRPDMIKTDRLQLVGLLTDNEAAVPDEGAQITLSPPVAGTPMAALGHVTSAYWSPALARSIALALVSGGRSRIGSKICINGEGEPVSAVVVDPTFLDAKGERLRA